MKELNHSTVEDALRGCLYKADEIKDGKPLIDPVVVIGVNQTFGLHPERLSALKDQVEYWLSQLKADTATEPQSFLVLCEDKEGRIWGQHISVQNLCVLAIGLKLRRWYPFNPSVGATNALLWRMLPGGMPYFGAPGYEAPTEETE